MNFSDYFTKDNFKTILEHDQVDSEKIDNAWRDKYHKINEDNFAQPFFAFLTAKKDSEGLSKIQYSEGHLTEFSQVWNNFVENKPSPRKKIISETFYKILSNSTFNYEKEPVTEDFINTRYQKLVDVMTKGDFRPHDLSEEGCQCHDCGQRFRMNIKAWAPTFNVFEKKVDGTLDYRSFVAPESCLPSNVEQVKVNFPTGELIVADWVRVEGFIETVEYKGEDKWDDEKSISFAKGRIFMTNFYAQEHNFVHVSVGNSSPRVFQSGDSLVVGCLAYNDDDYEELDPATGFTEAASVCTDLWGVTMVDKQTLIEIVAKTMGDKAPEIVEQYLKDDTNHEIVQVNPGDYTLKFHGNYPEFNDAIKDNELPDSIEKFFTVSSTPKPQNKIKM